MTFRRAMVLIAMAFLWTASQIPLYFVSGGSYTTAKVLS